MSADTIVQFIGIAGTIVSIITWVLVQISRSLARDRYNALHTVILKKAILEAKSTIAFNLLSYVSDKPVARVALPGTSALGILLMRYRPRRVFTEEDIPRLKSYTTQLYPVESRELKPITNGAQVLFDVELEQDEHEMLEGILALAHNLAIEALRSGVH